MSNNCNYHFRGWNSINKLRQSRQPITFPPVFHDKLGSFDAVSSSHSGAIVNGLAERKSATSWFLFTWMWLVCCVASTRFHCHQKWAVDLQGGTWSQKTPSCKSIARPATPLPIHSVDCSLYLKPPASTHTLTLTLYPQGFSPSKKEENPYKGLRRLLEAPTPKNCWKILRRLLLS